MLLPLLDGVFLSIVLSDGLETIYDAILVGSFVFGGSATISVILSEFSNNTRKSIYRVLVIGCVVGIIAIIQTIFAPVIEPFIDTGTFRNGAVLALIALAIKILPFEKTDKMVSPLIIIVITLLVSVNTSPESIGMIDTGNVIYAIIAVMTAISISITTVIIKPYISDRFNDRILKYGTSFGLLFISLTILFPISSSIPFIVISVTLFASISFPTAI